MLNNITIVGRLTKDVEVTELRDGGKLVRFPLAINSTENGCEYIDCVVRKHLQDSVIANLVKGDKIVVQGQFANPKVECKDGLLKTFPKIFVETIEYIDVLKFKSDETPFEANTNEEEQPKPQPKEEPKKADPKPQTTRRR